MAINPTTVELARQGDRNAFSELYNSVATEMFKFAMYSLGRKEDAEDAVSETFMEAYKGIKNLHSAESFKPWIFRILSIRCKRKIGRYVDEKGNIDIDDYLEKGESGGEQERSEVMEAMAKLTAEEREMVILSVLYGYTMREIAEFKNLPQGTVSSKLHRTLKKLRTMLT